METYNLKDIRKLFKNINENETIQIINKNKVTITLKDQKKYVYKNLINSELIKNHYDDIIMINKYMDQLDFNLKDIKYIYIR